MRITFTLLLCLLTTATVYSQKKLKYDIIKETGDTLFYTSEEKIYNKPGTAKSVGEHLKTSIYKNGNNFRLCLSIQTGRTSVFTIGEGSSAEIKLKDGNTITLHCNGNQSSRATVSYYGCYIFGFYKLSPSVVQQLRSSQVSSITVHASIGIMEYEIKDKFSETLSEQLSKFSQ
jgi:hypothetical protein